MIANAPQTKARTAAAVTMPGRAAGAGAPEPGAP